jgi:hypothetical protein
MDQPRASTLEEARRAKPRALEVFTPLAPVVGVGITRIGDGYGLKVNLRSQPSPDAELPVEVDGVPIKVEVVGQPQKW